MNKLNLTVKNNAEKRVKDYLEQNASAKLAEKINKGVQVQKNGKTFVNKKTLSDFMQYASNEAKKQANGSNCACIDDQTLFGWAVHYFEEESIIGKLYDANGAEYEALEEVKTAPTKREPDVQGNQIDIFSILGGEQ